MTWNELDEGFSTRSSSSNPSSPGPGKGQLITRLRHALSKDSYWAGLLGTRESIEPTWSLHVAVFQEPFLGWVFEGKKSVESRFSQNQVAPYGEVRVGDVIALKKVGGPVVGVCMVNAAWSYRLDARTTAMIREKFAPMICAEDDEFWASRSAARFATLMSLAEVRTLAPIDYPKSDRRGWVVERGRASQQAMNL